MLDTSCHTSYHTTMLRLRGAGTGCSRPQRPLSNAAVVAAAAAAALAARKKDRTRNEMPWRQYGAELEAVLATDAALGDSPVKLVDARFLIELHARGGLLVRRQELPDAAFLTLEDLKHLPKGGLRESCLRIASASHAWQQPDTPDPKGISLKALAQFLEVLVAHGSTTYGIFLDFVSLHQKDQLGERTDAEAKLFGRALSSMMIWYAHPRLLTLKLTKLPQGYPHGFTFPPGNPPNVAKYIDRGWCFCESTVSGLGKDFDIVLDLGKLHDDVEDTWKGMTLDDIILKCVAQRGPPLTPQDFALKLSHKSFTSKKADEEMVSKLYADNFRARMKNAKFLIWSNLGWRDADVEALGRVIASGELVGLQRLDLSHNAFGDDGLRAFSYSGKGGLLPYLAELRLEGNYFGHQAVRFFAIGLHHGIFPSLKVLYIGRMHMRHPHLVDVCIQRMIQIGSGRDFP